MKNNYQNLPATGNGSGHIRLCKGFTLLIASLCLFGCSHKLWYVQDPVVFGNVKEEGDFKIAGGRNNGPYTKGRHLQCSYAVSDRHFMIASYTDYTWGGRSKKDSDHYGCSIMWGAGYYKEVSRNWVCEIAGGARLGENQSGRGMETVSFKHVKYFVQPAITFTSRYFELGLGARCGYMQFLSANVCAQTIMDKRETFSRFIDPALSLSFGFPRVKIGTQLSVSCMDNVNFNSQKTMYYPTDPTSLTLFLKVSL